MTIRTSAPFILRRSNNSPRPAPAPAPAPTQSLDQAQAQTPAHGSPPVNVNIAISSRSLSERVVTTKVECHLSQNTPLHSASANVKNGSHHVALNAITTRENALRKEMKDLVEQKHQLLKIFVAKAIHENDAEELGHLLNAIFASPNERDRRTLLTTYVASALSANDDAAVVKALIALPMHRTEHVVTACGAVMKRSNENGGIPHMAETFFQLNHLVEMLPAKRHIKTIFKNKAWTHVLKACRESELYKKLRAGEELVLKNLSDAIEARFVITMLYHTKEGDGRYFEHDPDNKTNEEDLRELQRKCAVFINQIPSSPATEKLIKLNEELRERDFKPLLEG